MLYCYLPQLAQGYYYAVLLSTPDSTILLLCCCYLPLVAQKEEKFIPFLENDRFVHLKPFHTDSAQTLRTKTIIFKNVFCFCFIFAIADNKQPLLN